MENRESDVRNALTSVVAVCYLVVGALIAMSLMWLASRSPPPSTPLTAHAPSSAPSPGSLASFDLSPLLHYDPAAAVLPDPKVTPRDVLPDAAPDVMCTPGWATEHRHVTEGMRDDVYVEYHRPRDAGCCLVDHLIALELDGSNEMRNLWPQLNDPKPGAGAEDQLENELHKLVCSGRM